MPQQRCTSYKHAMKRLNKLLIMKIKATLGHQDLAHVFLQNNYFKNK